MEIKNEEAVNNEYATKEESNNQIKKTKKGLNKWAIVGATLIVTGIVAVGGIVVYKAYDTAINSYAGGLQTMPSNDSINMYNSRYLNYVSSSLSASGTRTLINMVLAHNANEQEVYEYGEIEIVGINKTTKVENTKHYNVNITDYHDIGTVKAISIQENE